MERTIKILLIGLFITGSIFGKTFAEDFTMQKLTTPIDMAFADCTKTYNISAENLYYLTISSIAANRFEIKELQSKMSYVLFKVNDKEFLASVAYYGDNKSILKITPVNSSYHFAPGIVSNIFKFIDLETNQVKEIQKS